ncbi:MAG: ABC transporter substrate-binding protein [Halobacteriales archaeon]
MSSRDSATVTGISGGRRHFIKSVAAGGLVATGAAGCLGTEGDDDGDGDTPTDTPSGTDTPTGPDTIVVGQPASITGDWDFLQPAASNATDLAVDEINAAGGPLDAEFEVSRRDTAVDPTEARQVFQQLVNNDDAVAINGLFSSEIVPMWDFIQDQEIPIITPWPGATFLDTRGGDKGTPDDLSDDEWMWRTVIGDTVHTAGAAGAMIDHDIETMGILSATTAGEEGWTQQFVNWFESLGGEVVEVVDAETDQSTYQSQLNELFSSDFDAWALSFALEDATTIIRDWDEGDYGRQLLMEDGLRDTALIDAVGEEADGAWVAAGSTQGPNYDRFESNYFDEYEEDLHPWGVAAYDATNVLALAIHRAGSTDPDDIQQSIGAVGRPDGTTVSNFADGKEALDNGEEINYEGAVTNCDFTDHGNVWGNVTVERVTPDGFEEEFVVTAEELQEQIDEY